MTDMTQAPTPGPLSGDDWDAIRAHPCYGEHQPDCDCVIPDQNLAPTAPVEASGSELAPCPFCRKPLTVRKGVNGYGRCDTEGCWMKERAMTVPVDDPGQVASWNASALRPQPSGETREAAWTYCPECGSDEVGHEEGDHKQCGGCGQEWFSDLDYSDVVQKNLARLSARPAPVASGGQHSSGEGAFLGHLIAPKSGVGAVFVPKGEPVPLMDGRGSVTPVYSGPQNVTAPVAETAGEAVAWDKLIAALADALAFIDDMGTDLHHARVADWYPEGAHNAASQMSEDMRLAGNRCATYESLVDLNEAIATPPVPAQDDDKLRIMRADDVPVWSDGIVTDGERVAMAQKAEADYGGTYWATDDGGDGALEWEPTHFIDLAALKSTAAQEGGSK